jgi:AcrR family transcriptional regulator
MLSSLMHQSYSERPQRLLEAVVATVATLTSKAVDLDSVLYYRAVPRPELYPTDSMLDAARDLLVDRGSPSTTMEAISSASGAPTGSLYHRFGSRDDLVARLWIRAVYRSQAMFLVALEEREPQKAAVAAGLSILDFCRDEPGDARLLVSFRYEDLIRSAPSPAIAEELAVLNRPVKRAVTDLAKRLYGRASAGAVERTLLAVFDLPYGAVRRHLIAGKAPPRGLRVDLERAISAALGPSRHAA